MRRFTVKGTVAVLLVAAFLGGGCSKPEDKTQVEVKKPEVKVTAPPPIPAPPPAPAPAPAPAPVPSAAAPAPAPEAAVPGSGAAQEAVPPPATGIVEEAIEVGGQAVDNAGKDLGNILKEDAAGQAPAMPPAETAGPGAAETGGGVK